MLVFQSRDLEVAIGFRGEKGLIFGVDMNQNISCKTGIFECCDVSWISQFDESELVPNVQTYQNWDAKMITRFILSLNNEYNQYQNELIKQFKEQNFNGSLLPELEKNDLIHFGIKDFRHRTNIYKALKSVVDGTFEQKGIDDTQA